MTTTDPVCGMTVDPAAGPPALEHEGRRYHFCCAHCMQRFAEAPEQWLDSRPAPQATAPAMPGSGYTCPMHPRSSRTSREPARTAAWLWSRSHRRPPTARTRS